MTDSNGQDILFEVRGFLFENSGKYLTLLKEVRNFLNELRADVASNQIYRLYSRKDNRDESDEFKSIEKIAAKLARWRQKYGQDRQVKDVHDIIGVSVVVFYDSDISKVFLLMKEKCEEYNLSILKYLSGELTHRYKDYGYHAQHLVLTSLRPSLMGLKCEVQIKTLLHDAWHNKTHDLTYKPPGDLGEEHIKIMESFGESIQGIEIQSEMIRTLVTQDWKEEDDLRHSARVAMIDWLEDKDFGEQEITENYKQILAIIQSDRERIKTCSIVDDLVRSIINQIRGLRGLEGGLDAAWPLMVYVSSIRPDNHLNHMAKEYLRDWLKKEENEARTTLYKSFTYYMIGERAEAIREIDEFLRGSHLDDREHRLLKFNLLYYLIEEASYSAHRATELRKRCDVLIESLQLQASTDLLDLAIKDTLGYYGIIFGSTREEIERGIRLCQAAYSAKAGAQDQGERFMVLHERIGWRRYLRARS